jgi:hypothetical protein
MSPAFLVKDPELLVAWLWRIFPTFFMSRGCWICLLQRVFLLGLLLKILRSGQGLIVFLSLLIGKPGFQVSQKRLPHICSDHFPLLLDSVNGPRGKRPFKFENMWLKKEGFGALVKQWWDSYHFQGLPSFIFACKIKALKMNLKKWNEEVFGNIECNKSKLLDNLSELDAIEETRALDSAELAMKGEVSRELGACLLMEEVSWRQKSRILWLKEGDKCSKFFHSMANYHRRYNSIDSLMIEGILSNNQAKISEHIVKYYQKLFEEQCQWRLRMGWSSV